jgi:hypothetical protein
VELQKLLIVLLPLSLPLRCDFRLHLQTTLMPTPRYMLRSHEDPRQQQAPRQ